MNNITNGTNADLIEKKVKTEKGFQSFQWYNSYYSIVYSIEISNFKGCKPPQWSHITKIETVGHTLVFEVCVFEDYKLYDLQTALKFDFLEFL